jgi:hypothetical protein
MPAPIVPHPMIPTFLIAMPAPFYNLKNMLSISAPFHADIVRRKAVYVQPPSKPY